MRIHLNLPQPQASGEAGPSRLAHAGAPPPLTALTPNGELILVELQGELEIDHQHPDGGQLLGTLSFDAARPDRPVLMISHHRLEGKFVNLLRPLAVLEKKMRQASPPSTAVLVDVANGKRRPQPHELEEEKQGKRMRVQRDSSPPAPPSPRRAKDSLDFSSSPPRPPAKSKASQSASVLDGIDEGNADDEEDAEEERQTAVYYDVVSVIRRKILFSKRPEPIVKLDASLPSKP